MLKQELFNLYFPQAISHLHVNFGKFYIWFYYLLLFFVVCETVYFSLFNLEQLLWFYFYLIYVFSLKSAFTTVTKLFLFLLPKLFVKYLF